MKDCEFSYSDIGQGKPVLMVHGMSLSSLSFQETAKALVEDNYRVILVDLPGHGKSAIPPKEYKFSVENISNSISELMQQLKIPEFDIIGHSMGGIISLYLARQHPGKIKRVVVIDSPVFGAPRKLLLTYPLMGHITEYFLGKRIIKKYIRAMFHQSNKIDPAFLESVVNRANGKGFWLMLSKLSKEMLSRKFEAMKADYHNFKTRTLVIWGEEDQWLSSEVGEKFNTILPNSKLVTIANSGHNPHQECSGEVNKEILGFLGSSAE